jgi:hypothetical protein
MGENIIHIFFTLWFAYLKDSIILLFIVLVLKNRCYTKIEKNIFFVLNSYFLVIDYFFKYTNIFSEEERWLLYFIYLIFISGWIFELTLFKSEKSEMYIISKESAFTIVLIATILFLYIIFKNSILLFIISLPLLFLVAFVSVTGLIGKFDKIKLKEERKLTKNG